MGENIKCESTVKFDIRAAAGTPWEKLKLICFIYEALCISGGIIIRYVHTWGMIALLGWLRVTGKKPSNKLVILCFVFSSIHACLWVL